MQDTDAVLRGLQKRHGHVKPTRNHSVVCRQILTRSPSHLVVHPVVGDGSSDVVDQRVDEVLTLPHCFPAFWAGRAQVPGTNRNKRACRRVKGPADESSSREPTAGSQWRGERSPRRPGAALWGSLPQRCPTWAPAPTW